MSEKNNKPAIPNYKLASIFGAISYILCLALHVIHRFNDGVYRPDEQAIDIILSVAKCHGIILMMVLAGTFGLMALVLLGCFEKVTTNNVEESQE